MFLDAFKKLRKATSKLSNVCPSFRPSVRMEQLGSHWTDFHEIWFWIFRNSVRKNQVSLKMDKRIGYFT